MTEPVETPTCPRVEAAERKPTDSRQFGPQDATYWRSRAENAWAEIDRMGLHQITQWLELQKLKAQRDAVLALHTEFEGRCTECCEYCDCLDKDPCTHGNVPWPCRTAAIYKIEREAPTP